MAVFEPGTLVIVKNDMRLAEAIGFERWEALNKPLRVELDAHGNKYVGSGGFRYYLFNGIFEKYRILEYRELNNAKSVP